MPLDTEFIDLLRDTARRLEAGFEHLPPVDPVPGAAAMREVLDEVAVRLHDNFPYQHPLYAGQMLKPPHPVAHLVYTLAMSINPNNHALDGGRASSAMEKEAVASIAQMFGWEAYLGHLTAGGTMANLEALWVAGRLQPGKVVVASEQAHYTHSRISDVLGLGFDAVAVDGKTRMDLAALERRLARGDVGTVVATLGTTGTGAVDPLPGILDLRQRFPFRLHVDAAYGGYYKLVQGLAPDARSAFAVIDAADSIVVDPHKHGLQPYGCGCVLFKDPSVGRHYRHDSPYTYFSSDELHLGEISLECSRAGAAAVALWATQKLLPLDHDGVFAAGLGRCHAAAEWLFGMLDEDSRYLTLFPPELDIVVWAPAAATTSEISRRARSAFAAAAQRHLHLALMELPAELLARHWPQVSFDTPSVTCLRSCLMKPEHFDWKERIWKILSEEESA